MSTNQPPQHFVHEQNRRMNALAGLCLVHIHVSAVHINRVLPEQEKQEAVAPRETPFFGGRRRPAGAVQRC